MPATKVPFPQPVKVIAVRGNQSARVAPAPACPSAWVTAARPKPSRRVVFL
jgi:hypothetical protein